IVSVEGTVHVLRAQNTTATKAQLDTDLCPGDSVVVQERSRAALLLANRTTLRLDQKSTLVLEAVEPNRGSLLSLLYGRLHTLTRTPRPFRIRMGQPAFINANVEGTEFFVAVAGDRGEVGVFEGRVSATTEQGSVSAGANEAVIALRGQAPQKQLLLRPRDAVQWALYYPAVFDLREDRVSTGRAYDAALRQAARQYRANDVAGALSALDAVPESARDSPFHVYRAGLLLSVGRVDEAEPALRRAVDLDARNADALALLAVIALVRDDKQVALERAEQAIAADSQSSAARIAQSYALQAAFRLDDALIAAQRVTEADPGNALAWARRAELQMSVGELNGALRSAGRAAALDPQLARTQTVLGFANLVRIDTGAARNAFQRAITLDPADFLPRLGLGLARIREGDLAAGREQIEIAAVLDPGNSLVRSYLGKAYYEEKRDALAGAEFDLAKALDPNDPTAFLYDAIRKHTENRPVEALDALQTSIELNENRAVYRSRLGLDQDQAARSANQARIYDDLGFPQAALAEAFTSVTLDPGDYSSHLFLANAYANLRRYDISRLSEALQARLRQPAIVPPYDAQLTSDNLLIMREAGPSRLGANEFNLLFNKDQVVAQLDTITGNRGTFGDQVSVRGLADRTSFAATQLHYETDGFGRNDAARKNFGDAFVQIALTPKATVQLEINASDLRIGENIYEFDPVRNRPVTLAERTRSARVGGYVQLEPESDLIWTSARENQERSASRAPGGGLINKDEAKTYTGEVQYLRRFGRNELVTGAGHLHTTDEFVSLNKIWFTSTNAYAYWTGRMLADRLTVQGGVAADRLSVRYSFNNDVISRNQWTPKLGVMWKPLTGTTVRAASLIAVRRPFVGSQTLEPTQIAGCNQYFTGFQTLYG
ncbi:MAG TPA: FecR domain-containing protein, partial [Burkholderiales bacterium]